MPNTTGLTEQGFHWILTLVLFLGWMLARRWYFREPALGKGIMMRWLRWLLVAFGTGGVCYWVLGSETGYWRFVAIGGLLWGFAETFRSWLFVRMWSRSEWPLFPRYQGEEDMEWPASIRFFDIRDWLRDKNFKNTGFYKAYYRGESFQSLMVFEDEAKLHRIQIMIMIDETGNLLDQVSMHSRTTAGRRIVTDNVSIPFGGFYPDFWWVTRKPLIRQVQRLFEVHQEVIGKIGEALEPWDVEVLEDIHESQRLLEGVNEKAGFLNQRVHREDFGKLTGDGCYQIWKQIWLMNYLGWNRVRRFQSAKASAGASEGR